MGRVRVNYEQEAASVEIIDGVAHITPAGFPEKFVLPVHALKQFCLDGLAKIEAWEAGEADKVSVFPVATFERRYPQREAEPAA